VAEFNQAFQDALKESLDPESGRIKPGARGPDPTTEILEPLPEIVKPRRFRQTTTALLLLLLLIGPLAFWGISTYNPGSPPAVDATQGAFTGEVASLLPDSGGTAAGADGTPLYGSSLTPTDASGYSLDSTQTLIMTPTATRVLNPTQTRTRTATPIPVPTSTRTQAPSPTHKPTNTPTTSSPPTQNPCDEIDLSDFDVSAKSVVWWLNNGESYTITIDTIEINWPVENQRLEEVRIGGETIWDGKAETSPTTVGGGGQSLGSGGAKEIVFIFKKAAEDLGYSLQVTMENGCIVSAQE
jgi:hypothetical protein